MAMKLTLAEWKFLFIWLLRFVGLACFLAAFPIIVWNEGHSLHISKSLELVKNIVVSISKSPIDLANNNKLVHVTGMVSSEKLTDPIFGVDVNAVTLVRKVSMFQNTMKYDNGGYGNEMWSEEVVDFTGNKNKAPWLFPSQSWQVKKIQVGDFDLPSELVAKIPSQPAPVAKARLEELQAIYHMPMQFIKNDTIYAGKDPDHPTVGDMKINITVILPQQVSIIAEQQQSNLKPYLTATGEDIFLLYPGQLSVSELLAHAQQENTINTWIYRLIALVGLFQGLRFFKMLLTFLAKYIPIAGRLLSYSLSIAAFYVASILAIITILISWLAYRV